MIRHTDIVNAEHEYRHICRVAGEDTDQAQAKHREWQQLIGAYRRQVQELRAERLLLTGNPSVGHDEGRNQ